MNHVLAPTLPAFPAGCFTARQGLRPGDAAAFPGVRLSPDRITARHVDGRGHPLGEEVYGEHAGRPFVRYTREMRKGLVVSRIPGVGSLDLVLVEGALAALAAAALDGGEDVRPLVFVGLGGFWNGEVAEEVALFCAGRDLGSVLVAFSDHHAAGVRMRQAALEDLAGRGLPVLPLPCPPGGWRAGLLAARGALLEAPR